MGKQAAKKILSTRVSPEIYEKIKNLSDNSNKTISETVELILKKEFNAESNNGFVQKKTGVLDECNQGIELRIKETVINIGCQSVGNKGSGYSRIADVLNNLL